MKALNCPQPSLATSPWWCSGTLWIFVDLGLGILLGEFLPQDQHPQAYLYASTKHRARVGTGTKHNLPPQILLAKQPNCVQS
jgi:hypothetical protein